MNNDTKILELIRAVEQADSASSLLNAVRSLSSARLEEAIPTLITVLGYNNPGAAVAAVEGLIELGKPAVQPLLEQLDDYNYGARSWAIRALAGIGDPRGLDVLLSAAATDFALSVRRAATKGLGTIRWSELSSDEIQSAGAKVLNTLLQVSQDHEWIVRYASVVALQALASETTRQKPDLVPQILARLDEIAASDADLAVRARAVMAQQCVTTTDSEHLIGISG